jgi:hypothetical protein
MFEAQEARRAPSRALEKTGSRIAASIAMMASTIRTSFSVKPARWPCVDRRLILEVFCICRIAFSLKLWQRTGSASTRMAALVLSMLMLRKHNVIVLLFSLPAGASILSDLAYLYQLRKSVGAAACH